LPISVSAAEAKPLNYVSNSTSSSTLSWVFSAHTGEVYCPAETVALDFVQEMALALSIAANHCGNISTTCCKSTISEWDILNWLEVMFTGYGCAGIAETLVCTGYGCADIAETLSTGFMPVYKDLCEVRGCYLVYSYPRHSPYMSSSMSWQPLIQSFCTDGMCLTKSAAGPGPDTMDCSKFDAYTIFLLHAFTGCAILWSFSAVLPGYFSQQRWLQSYGILYLSADI